MNQKIKQRVLFYLLSMLSIFVQAQYSYRELLEKSKTFEFTEERIDSILTSYTKKDSIYADNAHGFSFYFHKKKKDYHLAVKYALIEIEVLESLQLNNKNYTNALFNLGRFYNIRKEYKKAIKNYKKAVKSNAFPLKVGQSYCQLGDCYYKIGDYYKSLDFYMKGYPILEKVSSKKSLIIQAYQLARNCNKLNTKRGTRIGLKYLYKADSILRLAPEFSKEKNIFYPVNNCFANLYSLKHEYDFEKAKYFYTKNLKRALKDNWNVSASGAYSNLGELYLKRDNDSCLFFFKESLRLDDDKIYYYETKRNISKFYQNKGEYYKSLEYIKKSLNYSFKTNNNEEIKTLSFDMMLNTRDKRSIVQALNQKAEVLLQLFEQTKEKGFLKKLVETVNISERFVNVLIDNNAEKGTRFLWRDEVSKIFGLGIKAAYLLNDTELMFSYMEKNKAFLLLQDIANYGQVLELPGGLVKRNLSFKKQILTLESQNKEIGTSKQRDSLFTLKENYERFLRDLEQEYPQNFLNYSEDIKQVSLKEITSKLLDNEVLLSYSLGYAPKTNKKELTGLLVSKNKTIPFVVTNTPEILINLKEYQQLISKPLANKEEMNRFNAIAYELYTSLFPSVELRELIKNKKLSIVQDVSLENIPFEALITNEEQQRYLIEDCDINYFYSSSFLVFNNKQKRKNDDSISLFAPINFENKELTSIDNSKNEVETIENILGGNLYLHKKASKYNFLKNTTSSKIIHLATHASSTGSPQIHFQDSTLQLHELYTYKNNADLVVLSACETNIGEVKKGEGTLNLARGFFYSGAKSVISSLWNVNDQSTSYLMKEFYTNLSSGKSKISSISEAKRSYLQQHQLSERSPYYWASFVLIGDAKAPLGNNITLYYILFGVLLIAIVFFIKKRVTKIKKQNY